MKGKGNPATIRARFVPLLVAICLGAVACGSTVQQRAGQQLLENSGQGLGQVPGSTSPNGIAPGAPNASGSLTGGSNGTGVNPTGPGSNFSSGTRGKVIGITPTSIYVGIGYSVNADQASAAFGIQGISAGDQQGEANAVIKDINSHGGVAGRKLVPVFWPDDQTSTQPKAEKQQAECSHFTEDHHVFFTLDGGEDSYLACIEKTAINLAGGETIAYGSPTFRRYRYFVDVNTLNMDRAMASQVPMLAHQKYFSGWNFTTAQPGVGPPVVAILGFDDPLWNHAIFNVLLPQLGRVGIHVAPDHVFRTYAPQGLSDQGQGIAAIQNAVLKMHQEGVTHVILMDSGGGLTLVFSNAAYSQRYFPRYAITTANGAQALVDSGNIQPQTMNGAMGIGWEPNIDLSPALTGDNSKYSTNARRHCLRVMRSAGITFQDVNAKAIALVFCDQLYFFRQIANSVSGPLNRDSFMAAVNRVGYGFESAEIIKSFFDPSNHEGVIVGWDMRYYSDCRCVKYLGSAVTIPSAG